MYSVMVDRRTYVCMDIEPLKLLFCENVDVSTLL